ncbi:MAG: helix-turn-helix domain-containing protein [Acidobacteriota bacterium]
MSKGYGQYCPLALAAELLCQRWTILVLSRLIDGCRRFNEIQAGVPGMSPSLLSKRLRELQDAGLVRKITAGGRQTSYELTDSGREAEAIVMSMAVWGQQWARDMEMADLDPEFLVWSLHMGVDVDSLPAERLVLEFEFSGCAHDCDRFWLVCEDRVVEMCVKDPGLEPDVTVQSDLRLFVEAWRGFRDLKQEIAEGNVRVFGPPELTRRLADWLLGSTLAPYPRKRQGRERQIWERQRSGSAERLPSGTP